MHVSIWRGICPFGGSRVAARPALPFVRVTKYSANDTIMALSSLQSMNCLSVLSLLLHFCIATRVVQGTCTWRCVGGSMAPPPVCIVQNATDHVQTTTETCYHDQHTESMANAATMPEPPAKLQQPLPRRARFASQTGALLRINVMLQFRARGSSICLLISPVLFSVLLLVLQLAINGLLLRSSEYACGCQCLACCIGANCSMVQTGTCQHECRTYNKSACGVQFSSPQQALFCPLDHPSSWPAVLQVCKVLPLHH